MTKYYNTYECYNVYNPYEVDNFIASNKVKINRVNCGSPVENVEYFYGNLNVTEAVKESFDNLVEKQIKINESKPIPKPADPVERVFFNYQKGATTIKWTDGTFTTVRCQDGEPFDEEKAIALCFMKKTFNNRGCYNDFIHKYMVDAEQVGPIYTDEIKELDETHCLPKTSKASEIDDLGAVLEAVFKLNQEDINSIFKSDNEEDEEDE